MKSAKPRRRLWLLGLLLAPPAFWALLLTVVPTDWARVRLIAALEQATERRVHLGSVRLGMLGGIRLRDLEIGEPQPDQSPWLRVEDLRVDINLAELLSGRCEPSNVEADGVALRIHRRQDGTFEFGDLLRANPKPESATPEATTAAVEERPPLQFRLGGVKLNIIDEPSETRLEFVGVEATGTWQRRKAILQELKGELNGGRLELAAQLDRGAVDGPSFEGQLRASGVGLGVGMNGLSYLIPVLAGMPAELDGKLDLDLDVRGQGGTTGDVGRTLVGRGNIALDPIRLDGSKIVAELSTALHLPAEERVGSIRSDFDIRDGRIASKDLTLKLGRVPIPLAGWTDFQGRVDYRVRPDALSGRLPAGVQGILSDLSLDATDLMSLRVQGTVEDLAVTVDGVPISGKSAGDPSQRADSRARLREAARRLRQRVLR